MRNNRKNDRKIVRNDRKRSEREKDAERAYCAETEWKSGKIVALKRQ